MEEKRYEPINFPRANQAETFVVMVKNGEMVAEIYQRDDEISGDGCSEIYIAGLELDQDVYKRFKCVPYNALNLSCDSMPREVSFDPNKRKWCIGRL